MSGRKTEVTLRICETCQNRQQAEIFLANVQNVLPRNESIIMEFHACFNACAQGPIIALQSPKGHTYLFGPTPFETAAQDAAAAVIEYQKGDGYINDPMACGVLRECLIALVPPLSDPAR